MFLNNGHLLNLIIVLILLILLILFKKSSAYMPFLFCKCAFFVSLGTVLILQKKYFRLALNTCLRVRYANHCFLSQEPCRAKGTMVAAPFTTVCFLCPIWPSLFAFVSNRRPDITPPHCLAPSLPHPFTVTPPRYHTPSLSRPLVITPPSCGAPVHGAYHRGRARYHTPPIKASPVMMCFKGQKVYRRSVLFTRVMRVRCSRCTKFGWVRKRIIVVLHADECHHPNAKPNPPTNKSAKNGPKRWFQPLFFCSWTGVALVYL